jgi:hypothetical protein
MIDLNSKKILISDMFYEVFRMVFFSGQNTVENEFLFV